MATSVLSGSRAGVGSAVATAPAGGTFQLVGVGTVASLPAINLAASLSAKSWAAGALSLFIPVIPHAAVLSGSRAGIGSAAVTATPLGESIWDAGGSTWDGGTSTWDGTAAQLSYQIVGVGVTPPVTIGPAPLALAGSLTATSQGRAARPTVSVTLSGQITATSRATAYLPRSITLAARLTSFSAGRSFYAPPPGRVLAGRGAATSSAAAHATITSVSGPRQTEVSIIT